jgi:hypothetical protein
MASEAPMKIFVVFGETQLGHGEDYQWWAVRAFRNENAAEEFAAKAHTRASEIFSKGYEARSEDVKKRANEFDPQMDMDEAGTDYKVLSVELED